MISINNVSVLFGSFELLSDIKFMINPKDRIGLVGKNGAGKTTLLKIIAGIDEASKGKVQIPSGVKMGYLAQQIKLYEKNNTLIEEAKEAFNEILQLDKDIEILNEKIATETDFLSDTYQRNLENLTGLSDRRKVLGANNLEADIEKVLKGLGFIDSDFHKKTSEFSGGWRIRIELAKLLLTRPEVLLLDEPTNHLDIISIQWLEEYLKEYFGAVVIISHDRTFLDNVTNRTIEITAGKIYDYKVAYTEFIRLRKERVEQQLAAYENQQKYIQETTDLIERFRYKASKAKQVQSRIKALEKLEKIKIDDLDTKTAHFKFPDAQRAGILVVETEELVKSYGDLNVLKNVDFIIERGDKIALVGKNGEGKSTLIKTITHKTDFSGNVKLGNNVKIGYFAQNQNDLLDENITVFETLDNIAVGDARTKVKSILGSFLFSGEDIDKKVKVLSGGEKSRLSLAKFMLESHNFLILDEPTNHLDMDSKDILKQALLQFNGTVLIVSHDRYFLNGLVNKVYEVIDKSVKEEIGGINNYLARYKAKIVSLLRSKAVVEKETIISSSKEKYLQRKELEKRLRKFKNMISSYENEIEELESQIAELDIKMQDTENHTDDFFANYNNLKKNLSEKELLWAEESEKLEEIIVEKSNLD